MSSIKQYIYAIFRWYASCIWFLIKIFEKFISYFSDSRSFFVREYILGQIFDQRDLVVFQNHDKAISFFIHTPNQICKFRYQTFATKEPDLLGWIRDFGGNGVFFDIGANVGLYSIYYALTHSGSVYSFEPSFFNVKQLAKNISSNQLSDRIVVISNPLTDQVKNEKFHQGSDVEGGALSSFGVDYGFDGKILNSDISYKILGLSLDFMFDNELITEIPSLVKIDVDGTEHLILKGARKILAADRCRTVLIEVNDRFIEQSREVFEILSSIGFILVSKDRSPLTSGLSEFGDTYNQIWVKRSQHKLKIDPRAVTKE